MNKTNAVLVCFSELSSDARSLNLAKLLSKHYQLYVFALKEDNFINQNDFNYIGLQDCDYGRMINRWIKFNKKLDEAIKALNVDIDLYIASDLYAVPIGYKLKSKSKIGKLVYDSREIYSQLGNLHNRKLTQFIITNLEKKWVKKVDKIFASAPFDCDYLQSHFKRKDKVELLLNLPPFQNIIPNNELRKLFGISKDSPILIYQGALLPNRGIEDIFNILNLDSTLHYVIFGDSSYANELQKKVEGLGVSKQVHFAGKLAYNELLQYTASADIGLSLFKPVSLSYQYSLPNKLFEYTMAGIPSICTNLPEMKQIADKYSFVKAISPQSSAQELLKTIHFVLNSEFKTRNFEEFEKAKKEFCYEIQHEHILNVVK